MSRSCLKEGDVIGFGHGHDVLEGGLTPCMHALLLLYCCFTACIVYISVSVIGHDVLEGGLSLCMHALLLLYCCFTACVYRSVEK